MQTLKDGRLPSTVTPRRYDLRLQVEPDAGEFSGSVVIDVQIREAVSRIILHAVELDIQSVKAEAGGVYEPSVSYEGDAEIVILTFPRELPVGPAVLTLAFRGRLNRQMKGLYEATAGTEKYAFTQFEATDARRAFPCFDEPGFKASFRITAVIPEHLMALSNMDVERETLDRSTRRKTVSFKETPPMSTYLVALGVARLVPEQVIVAGTRVTIYTTPEHRALTNFAKDVMNACLPRLNDYFGLRYPISKLDLVGVPDFAMGAMENWGAIFFRENRLLADTSKASVATLRAVANVITHEVVHQWFGNLVTMWWWDDLWLNESFATWLACKIVDDWRPDWLSWMEFARDKHVPLSVDALDSTRPISSKVRTAAEAEEMFDALTYEKGASVLRMLEQFLGEEVFRQGIREYIAAHQYKNAAAADLWEALAKASGQPVTALAQDWFTRPGFPLVTVRAKGTELDVLQVEQCRFVAAPDRRGVPNELWTIPLSVSYEDDTGGHSHRTLMTEQRGEIRLPARGRVRWVYANAGEQGYYRTQHDRVLQEALVASRARLPAEERFGLLDNLWALTLKGVVGIDEFLDLARHLRGDGTRVVIEALAGYCETLHDRLAPDTDRRSCALLTADLLQPVAESLGWEGRRDEGDEPKLARAALLWALGSIARPQDLTRAMGEWLQRYWVDPASLDPTLVGSVIRLGARLGDRTRFERYVEQYQSARTPEERDRYLAAFGDFADPAVTPAILAFILSESVRGQDIWKPLRGLLANPATQAQTWDFIQDNWPALRQKGGTTGAQRIISGTKHLWRNDWLAEVEAFFTKPANHVAAATRTLTQTLEFLRLGLEFRRLQQAKLSAWLREKYEEPYNQ